MTRNRKPPRRLDVTIGLHIDSEDTETETEMAIDALRAMLEGHEFSAGPTQHFRIVQTDQPIHVHSVVTRAA